MRLMAHRATTANWVITNAFYRLAGGEGLQNPLSTTAGSLSIRLLMIFYNILADVQKIPQLQLKRHAPTPRLEMDDTKGLTRSAWRGGIHSQVWLRMPSL